MQPITIDLGPVGVARLSAPAGEPLTLAIFTDGAPAVVIKQAHILDRLAASITAARTATKIRSAERQPEDAA